LSAKNYVFEISPVEDFLKLLSFNVAKVKPLVTDSRGHG